jgi:hypothetical protein
MYQRCHVPDPATQVSLGSHRSVVWLRDNAEAGSAGEKDFPLLSVQSLYVAEL